jgi:anti-sigma-K factor RskA
MTRSAPPDNWQDLLAGYVLGNLDQEEAQAWQQLLAEYPELATEIDQLQEALSVIPYNIPEREPPAHLRETILAAAERAPSLSPLFSPPVQPSPRRFQQRRWLVLASSIAAAALLGLGIENYRLRQEVEQTQPILAALKQPGAQLFALQGTEKAATAAGSIVITPTQQVLVMAQNLPQLPSGQVYRLWAMTSAAKKPAYCGQFNSNSTTTLSAIWTVSELRCSQTPTQLLITAESATAPPIPQGELVMKSRV